MRLFTELGDVMLMYIKLLECDKDKNDSQYKLIVTNDMIRK